MYKSETKYGMPKKWNPKLIPQRIIVGAVRDYCSNFKTCCSLVKNGNITHFNIRNKRKKELTQTLNLEKQCFSKKNNTLSHSTMIS